MPPESSTRDYFRLIVPGTIFVLGACLRFYHLGFHSLWLDEVVTVRDAMHPFRDIPSVIASYPPLWAYITRSMVLLGGFSDFWLRVPAAFFGALTVPAIWWIARKFYGDRAAFWAALLMAVSVFDVLYSQEVRMYSLVALEALVSMAIWTRAIESRDKKWWFGYAGITLLGLYTHNWFPLLVLAQGFWTLAESLRRKTIDPGALFAYTAIAFGYAPWIFVLKKQIALPVYGHLHAPGWKDIRETFYAYAGIRVPSGESLVGVGTDARFPLLLVSSGFLLRGLFFKDEARERAIRFFLVGCLLPVGAAFLISVFAKPIYLPGRYPILGLGAYLMTAGRGLQSTPGRWRRWVALLGGAWVVLSFYTLGRYYWFYTKSNWKPVCQWIAARSPGSEPLHLRLYAQYGSYFTEYYLHNHPIDEAEPNERLTREPLYIVAADDQNKNLKTLIPAPWTVTDTARFGSLTVYKARRAAF